MAHLLDSAPEFQSVQDAQPNDESAHITRRPSESEPEAASKIEPGTKPAVFKETLLWLACVTFHSFHVVHMIKAHSSLPPNGQGHAAEPQRTLQHRVSSDSGESSDTLPGLEMHMEHIYQQRINRLERKLAELVTENVKLRDELDTEQRQHDAHVGELQREIEAEVQELKRRQDMVCAGVLASQCGSPSTLSCDTTHLVVPGAGRASGALA